jgi:hypothetical protein
MGLFPVYFLHLQGRKFEFRTTPKTSEALVEYCGYMSRAMSLELTDSKDRNSTARMTAVPAIYAVYNPNAIYIYIQ